MAPPNVLAKQRRKTKPLKEDDAKVAEAVTHERITFTTRSGATKTKRVLVPLVAKTKDNDTQLDVETHDPMDFDERYQTPGHNDHYQPSGYDRRKKSKVRNPSHPSFIYLIKHNPQDPARLCTTIRGLY